MPSVVSKIKDAMHGGSSRYDATDAERDRQAGTYSDDYPDVPGAYQDTGYGDTTGRHADGREYIPPHGTHVGTGHGAQEVTNREDLMDPASRGTDSNVLGGHATSSTPQDDQTSGRGKLHKHNDPRGYESGAYASSVPSSGQHQGQGQHLRDNITGSENVPREQQGAHRGYADDTYGSQQHSVRHQHGREDIKGSSYSPNDQRDTRHGYADETYSSQQHSRHNPATTAAAAAGGLAASQLQDRSRHQDDTSRQATGAGMGAQQPYGATEGNIGQRDYATGGDNLGGGGIYNSVVGTGSQQHDQGTSRGVEDLTAKRHDAHPGVNPGQAGGREGPIPREAGDSRITSGHGALDPSLTSAAAAGSRGTNFSHPQQQQRQQQPYDSNTPHIPGQGPMARDSNVLGAGAGAGSQAGAGPGVGGLSGGTGTGTGTGNAGGMFPHSAAKVLHKCSACGHDNDISHYFKKDLVYRIDQ